MFHTLIHVFDTYIPCNTRPYIRDIHAHIPTYLQVIVVDMESGEIIYWNKYFEPSKEDLAEYRKKQFSAMREELLQTTKTAVDDAETQLKSAYTAHCIEVLLKLLGGSHMRPSATSV